MAFAWRALGDLDLVFDDRVKVYQRVTPARRFRCVAAPDGAPDTARAAERSDSSYMWSVYLLSVFLQFVFEFNSAMRLTLTRVHVTASFGLVWFGW